MKKTIGLLSFFIIISIFCARHVLADDRIELEDKPQPLAKTAKPPAEKVDLRPFLALPAGILENIFRNLLPQDLAAPGIRDEIALSPKLENEITSFLQHIGPLEAERKDMINLKENLKRLLQSTEAAYRELSCIYFIFRKLHAAGYPHPAGRSEDEKGRIKNKHMGMVDRIWLSHIAPVGKLEGKNAAFTARIRFYFSSIGLFLMQHQCISFETAEVASSHQLIVSFLKNNDDVKAAYSGRRIIQIGTDEKCNTLQHSLAVERLLVKYFYGLSWAVRKLDESSERSSETMSRRTESNIIAAQIMIRETMDVLTILKEEKKWKIARWYLRLLDPKVLYGMVHTLYSDDPYPKILTETEVMVLEEAAKRGNVDSKVLLKYYKKPTSTEPLCPMRALLLGFFKDESKPDLGGSDKLKSALVETDSTDDLFKNFHDEVSLILSSKAFCDELAWLTATRPGRVLRVLTMMKEKGQWGVAEKYLKLMSKKTLLDICRWGHDECSLETLLYEVEEMEVTLPIIEIGKKIRILIKSQDI